LSPEAALESPSTIPAILVTRQQTARALSLSERRIDQLLRSGELDAIRSGKRVLVTVESVNRYVECHRGLGA
jgi:excisionase family DNA binding protein